MTTKETTEGGHLLAFNPSSPSVQGKSIINGSKDDVLSIYPVKYPFAIELYQTMIKNTWVPQEVDLAKDVEQWNRDELLTEREKNVYKRSLAFVSNLDGLQTNNLISNIVKNITAPEVSALIIRQAFEEAVHVHSYSTMVEVLSLDAEEIYGMYKRDEQLYNKNKQVLEAVSKIASPTFQTGTRENDQLFLEACIGNMILEGIYFYSAFLTFYVFKRSNKMPGSAEMIQFINRDEDMHLRVFTHLSNALIKERPDLWTEDFKARIIKNFREAVEREYQWGVTCIGDGILGLTPRDLKEYLQFVGDRRLESLGLPLQWHSKNPFPWIDELTQGNMIETNFFEGTVREYSVGGLNWD